MTTSKAIIILTLVMLSMFSCVALVYRDDISDFQAYTRKNLQPDLPGYGEDVAP